VALPPKEIWLQWDGDGSPSNAPIRERGEVCWCQDKIFNGDIKYVRADSREDAVGKELNVALKNLLDAQDIMSRRWTGAGFETLRDRIKEIVYALIKLNHQNEKLTYRAGDNATNAL
jgi:hypothetical protein